MVMHRFDTGMLDASRKDVKLLSKSDVAHDIEAKKHSPSSNVNDLVPLNMRDKKIRFGADTRLIHCKGYRQYVQKR